ncbi:vacuolar transporter chaperone [Tulasnella sp. 408]|nr:vacuolar transporter chaperone [Tulasnella sp. 408]
MKFGRTIQNDLYTAWQAYYIDYSGLKKELKRRTSGKNWNEDDEKEFKLLLAAELDKIYQFQEGKVTELARRIKEAEAKVQVLVADYVPDDESDHADEEAVEAGDLGSDDDDDDAHSVDSLEEKFHELEEEVATLVADVHDLALYTKLNFTGFMKIVKKHDKQTGYPLKSTFVKEYLEKRPFYKVSYDPLIVKLSKLYDLVRTRGHPVQGDSSAGGSQSAFVRQTTKYWVHPDNLVHVKLAIMRHLPVLVFNPNKEFEPKDAAITSIYFDNEDLELYLGRLEKTEGAEAIRLRWYGDMAVKTIFVERKTHREDWTGEKSVKARFPIKEHNVNAFLRGEYTMDAEFQELVTKGKKTQAEVDNMIQLAQEVQYAVLTRKLQPVMRTFYNRTAFQLPGDARVPVPKFSKFIHGCATLIPNRVDLVPFWLPQMDVDIRKPDTGAVTIQINRPTSATHSSATSASPLPESPTEEGLEFGKYTEPLSEGEEDEDMGEAIAADEENRVGLDRGQASAAIKYRQEQLARQQAEASSSSTPQDDDPRKPFLKTRRASELAATGQRPRNLSIDPLAPSSVFDKTLQTKLQKESKRRVGFSDDTVVDEDADDEDEEGHRGEYEAPAPAPVGFFGKLKKLFAPEPEEEPPTRPEVEYLRVNAPEGKKIAVAVRIEPKVIFATERTFLKWLEITVLVGSIATTLLNFNDGHDTSGLISASIFTLAALVAILYTCIIFVRRALALRRRDAVVTGVYYDKWGPTIFCLILGGAIVTNVGLRMAEIWNV